MLSGIGPQSKPHPSSSGFLADALVFELGRLGFGRVFLPRHGNQV